MGASRFIALQSGALRAGSHYENSHKPGLSYQCRWSGGAAAPGAWEPNPGSALPVMAHWPQGGCCSLAISSAFQAHAGFPFEELSPSHARGCAWQGGGRQLFCLLPRFQGPRGFVLHRLGAERCFLFVPPSCCLPSEPHALGRPCGLSSFCLERGARSGPASVLCGVLEELGRSGALLDSPGPGSASWPVQRAGAGCPRHRGASLQQLGHR